MKQKKLTKRAQLCLTLVNSDTIVSKSRHKVTQLCLFLCLIGTIVSIGCQKPATLCQNTTIFHEITREIPQECPKNIDIVYQNITIMDKSLQKRYLACTINLDNYKKELSFCQMRNTTAGMENITRNLQTCMRDLNVTLDVLSDIRQIVGEE